MKEEEKVMEHLVLYRSKPLYSLFIWMLVFFIIMAVVLTLQKRFELSYLVIWIPILVLIGVGTIFRYSFYQDFYTRTQLYFGIFKGKEKKMNYDSIKCLEIRYLGYGREKPSITVHYSEKKIKSKWNMSRTMFFNFNHPELLIPLLTYLKEQTEVKIKINIAGKFREQNKLLKPFDNYSKRKYFEKNEN
jgi:hypothetical protein